MEADTPGSPEDDRRRDDRRADFVRLADYTIPELRKAFITMALLVGIGALFLYMVHEVVVAIIAGVVLAVYMIPFQRWAGSHLKSGPLTAIVTIIVVVVPVVSIVVYSWMEISGAVTYLEDNSEEVAARVTEALQRLPFGTGLEVRDQVPQWVEAVAERAGSMAGDLREALDMVVLGMAVFLFTAFYVLTDHHAIARYVRDRIPGRYQELADRISDSVGQVAYGALYATFVTQVAKAAIVLAMNLIWDVPLAAVLAVAAFFIGFLPIVGSWSVYVPVAAYLFVFRGDALGAVLMLVVGLLVNTIFISMVLRPRMAARKSGVLNFYWMFLALVTGVYTFGLAGIVIGPVLIALLRAVFETVAGREGAIPPPVATT